MILDNEKINNVEGNVDYAAAFTIEASAKMFDLLSTKIYSDIPRAIIRELCCNAIDANIDAGNEDSIEVSFPTPVDPTLIVQDYGVGMTHDDVMSIYTSYGRSTKTQSNKLIGALGLGGKTPLAYTKQFTLETARDGKKNSYIVYKDDMGVPTISLVNSMDSEETGTKVELIVKLNDFYDFYKAGAKTFLFFNKMPKIVRGKKEFYDQLNNWCLRDTTEDEYYEARTICSANFNGVDLIKKDSRIRSLIDKIISSYSTERLGVVMGQVYYQVDSTLAFGNDTYDKSKLKPFVFPSTGSNPLKILHVPMGSIAIQPSREVLNYNKITVDFLRTTFAQTLKDSVAVVASKYKKFADFFENYKDIPYIENEYIYTDDFMFKYREAFCNYVQKNLKSVPPAEEVLWSFIISDKRKYIFNDKDIFAENKDTNVIWTQIRTILNKKTRVIILDDYDFLLKVTKKFMETGKDSITVPVDCWRRLEAAFSNSGFDKINTFFTSASVAKKLSDMKIDFESVSYSSLEIKKEKEARVRGPIQRTKGCFDINFNEVDPKDIKGKVTYELIFNAPVSNRVITGNINWANLSDENLKRDDVMTNNDKSYYNPTKHNIVKESLKSCKIDITVPHYFLTWTFFKNNKIWKNKNWIHINDFYIKVLEANKNNIVTYLSNPVIKDVFWFGFKEGDDYSEKIRKYPVLTRTLFFTQNAEYEKQSKLEEDNPRRFSFTRDKIIQHLNEFLLDNHYDKKSIEGTIKTLEGIKIKSDHINYEDDLMMRYPMLKYYRQSGHNKDMYDYIALVEGIVIP